MEGGFPKGSLILVSGKCGAGTSTLAMQYIVRGIMDYGEPGVFVSLERDRETLYQEMLGFGWHLKALENQGNLVLMGGPLGEVTTFKKKVGAKIEDLVSEIIESAEKIRAERLAIDGPFYELFPDEATFREGLTALRRRLKEIGCTTVITSTMEEGKSGLSRSGVEEQVADGVVVLYYEGDGLTRERAIEVRKMRGIRHSEELRFFEIADAGVKLIEPKKKTKEGKSNRSKCLFCGRELEKPMSVRGGGRASFCDPCARKLEKKGLLSWYKDGTIGLKKPLLYVIERF
jgi:KaiC/GvpD/RAD55 family RecA-like ATPase